MKPLKIVWDGKSSVQFAEAIEYVYNDSPQNALRVKNDIEKIIDSLLRYPEKYPPDKNKINNEKGEYRAFEKNRLRICYRFYDNTIRIIRIRHTIQNPKSY